MKLQKNSRVPLHYQVKDHITKQLDKGVFQEGEQLPSEFYLAETLGVSRNTIRQALLALVNEGRLYRERGKGTFVMEKALQRGIPALTGFHEYVKGLGKTPSSQFKLIEITKSTARIKRLLNVREKDEIVHLHRIVGIDGKRAGIHEIYFPLAVWRKIDTPINKLKNTSMYTLMSRNCGIDLTYGDETIYVRAASEQESAELSLPPKSAVFVISRLLYDQNDAPVCYADNIYHPEKFKYYIKYIKPS